MAIKRRLSVWLSTFLSVEKPLLLTDRNDPIGVENVVVWIREFVFLSREEIAAVLFVVFSGARDGICSRVCWFGHSLSTHTVTAIRRSVDVLWGACCHRVAFRLIQSLLGLRPWRRVLARDVVVASTAVHAGSVIQDNSLLAERQPAMAIHRRLSRWLSTFPSVKKPSC